MLRKNKKKCTGFTVGSADSSRLAVTYKYPIDASGPKEKIKKTIVGTSSIMITASNEGNLNLNDASSSIQGFVVMITTTNMKYIKKSSVSIYSQPTSNEISIEFNTEKSTKDVGTSMFSLNGQFITQKIIYLNNERLKFVVDVSNLEGGIYFIEFVVE